MVCVFVCLLVMFVSPAKTAELIEGRGLTHVGPKNDVIDGVKIGQIICLYKGWQVGDATFCHIILYTCLNSPTIASVQSR